MRIFKHHHPQGMTLIELMIAIAIVGLLFTIALPAYNNYQDQADIDTAVRDIGVIGLVITDYRLSNNRLPADLAAIGYDGYEDPWGNPYEYINHQTEPPGKRRKDKNLVPINNDFDLYSAGEDGRSVAPLTANPSRDDIVRANNGSYVGLAEEY